MVDKASCELCGSAEQTRRYVFDDIEVVRCRSCGLVFNPAYHQLNPRRLYTSDYFLDRGGYFCTPEKATTPMEELAEHIRSFREGLKLIRVHRERGRLLDVGCAVGLFLSMARKQGWQVWGVDVSEYATSVAKRSFEHGIYTGELVDARFSSGFFDVITLWDVVEHLVHPLSVLREVRRILKDDGIVLLDTPNEGALIRKAAYLIYQMLARKVTYPARKLYHIYHLHYFSDATLRRLFDLSGFEVIEMLPRAIPREKGRGNSLERAMVKAFGVLEKPLGMDYELMALARKKPSPARV
jgi:2-polyprenyl-3-methyl-5-hydroxy-6-metoxy-1,4-benzoquinol methylase